MKNGGSSQLELNGREPKSVVLIGMRGAGKTSLGQGAASLLGWRFVDLDHLLEKRIGRTIADLVADKGMPAFRKEELDTLKSALSEFPYNTIIACGGGIVETSEALSALEQWTPVVHILKPMEDCERALATDPARMKLPEPLSVLWARRTPLYERCSDFEFYLRSGEDEWHNAIHDFGSFLKRVTGIAQRPRFDEDSFFLSLTFPNAASAVPLLPTVERGVDALEIRIDLLENQEPTFVKEQLAIFRRASTLPIIYTLRSKAQGGKYDGGCEGAIELLKLGVRQACEFVDVEANIKPSVLQPFLRNRRASLLIGSHHDMTRMPDLRECEQFLKSCLLGGSADIAKLVVGTSHPDDSVALRHTANALNLKVPFISINAGQMGKMSRILNRVFTPVTHPELPFLAAPGQMSAKEIMEVRRSSGYCEAKTFYIFGSPVTKSPSPSIHNAGFSANLTPHTYERFDTPDENVALEKLKSSGCGGGSVTIPLKEKLVQHMAHLSASAKEIGAINTITKQKDGSLHADNTDWLGIKRQFEGKLQRCGRPVTKDTLFALVLGAGGTARAACYAFKSMGCAQVLVYNRTAARAEEIAKDFGVKTCGDLQESLMALPRLDLVMGTVPGSAEVTLPESVLSHFKPVVFDAAYRPRDTPLLRAAVASGCPTIEGIEMLFEQGCAQCQIWTERRAPRREIAQAIIRDCFASDETIPEGLKVEVEDVPPVPAGSTRSTTLASALFSCCTAR